MTDYIKREDVKRIICKNCTPTRLSDCTMCKRIYEINEIPSVDVAERKNGQWLYMDSDSRFPWRCSECGCASITTHSIFRKPTENFCLNCGVDMRGDNNN